VIKEPSPYAVCMTYDQRLKLSLFLSLAGSLGVLGLALGLSWTITGQTPWAPVLAGVGAVLIVLTLVAARRAGR
jgi:ABC-type antimicrobial peptide transport system permease subunit